MLTLVRLGEKPIKLLKDLGDKNIKHKLKSESFNLEWKYLERPLSNEEKRFFTESLLEELKVAQEICKEEFPPLNFQDLWEVMWETKRKFLFLEISYKEKNKKTQVQKEIIGIFPIICISSENGIRFNVITILYNKVLPEEVLDLFMKEVVQKFGGMLFLIIKTELGL